MPFPISLNINPKAALHGAVEAGLSIYPGSYLRPGKCMCPGTACYVNATGNLPPEDSEEAPAYLAGVIEWMNEQFGGASARESFVCAVDGVFNDGTKAAALGAGMRRALGF